jgi:hypothetical protein
MVAAAELRTSIRGSISRCYQVAGGGLNLGQDERGIGFGLGFGLGLALGSGSFFTFALEFFEHPRDAALGLEFLDSCWGSERAELRVFGDLLDEEGRIGVERLLGQGDDGGLEAVEQQAGAARVEVVGGDALQHQRDGVQDAAAVGELVGAGEREGATTGLARGGVLDGAARGVVLVAELLPAQAGRGAAVAVGEDVAAAEALADVGLRGVVALTAAVELFLVHGSGLL